MLKLAVFGRPVAHSLSPRIHRRFAESCGLEIDYQAIDCPAGDLNAALHAFRQHGGCGCNLTVPLKAEGLDIAGSWTRAAREAGACNTLTLSKAGSWHADNTDGAGLMRDLARLGLQVNGQRVLMVGAGGAAAGILGPLLGHQPEAICVINRDRLRAQQLCARFIETARGKHVRLTAAGLDDGPRDDGFDLVIQATSLGHSGQTPPLSRSWLAPTARAYDINYGKAFVAFRDWCQSAGVGVHSGLGMLIEQAALAFEQFTGCVAKTEPVHEELAPIDSASA